MPLWFSLFEEMMMILLMMGSFQATAWQRWMEEELGRTSPERRTLPVRPPWLGRQSSCRSSPWFASRSFPWKYFSMSCWSWTFLWPKRWTQWKLLGSASSKESSSNLGMLWCNSLESQLTHRQHLSEGRNDQPHQRTIGQHVVARP